MCCQMILWLVQCTYVKIAFMINDHCLKAPKESSNFIIFIWLLKKNKTQDNAHVNLYF